MIGRNQITLCLAEAIVAFQEYLDKRMGDYAPRVDALKMSTTDSTISLVTLPKEN